MRRSRWSVPAVLRTVFSFETCLLVFINVGLYKRNPFLPKSPVDLTLVMGALTLLAGGWVLMRRGFRCPPRTIFASLLCSGLFVMAAMSLLWSDELEAGLHKTLLAAPLSLLAFLAAALVIAPDRERLERFLTMTLATAFWVAFLTIVLMLKTGFAGSSSGGLDVENASADTEHISDYIMRGNCLAMGIVVLAGHLLQGHRLSIRALFEGASVLLFVFCILVTGSKQSLLGIALIFMVALGGYVLRAIVTQRFGVLKRMVLPVLLLLLGLAAVPRLGESGVNFSTLTRFEAILEGSSADSAQFERLQYGQIVMNTFDEAPLLGHGAGSFGPRYGISPKDHPHNILLDFAYDLGAVGVIAFLGLLVYCTIRFPWKHLLDDRLYFSLGLLVVFNTFTAFITESYSEGRSFMAVLGLITAITAYSGGKAFRPLVGVRKVESTVEAGGNRLAAVRGAE